MPPNTPRRSGTSLIVARPCASAAAAGQAGRPRDPHGRRHRRRRARPRRRAPPAHRPRASARRADRPRSAPPSNTGASSGRAPGGPGSSSQGERRRRPRTATPACGRASVCLPGDSFSRGWPPCSTSLYTMPRYGASALVPSRVPTPKASIGAPAATQRGDAVLVEVARREDLDGVEPGVVEDGARLDGERTEVAGVDAARHGPRSPRPASPPPPGARPRPCRRCRPAGRRRPVLAQVGAERLHLVVVGHDEGVGHRAGQREAVAPARLDQRRGRGAADVGGPGHGERRVGAVVAPGREVDEAAARRRPARTRAAFEAIIVSKPTVLMSSVSTSWASISGAVTVRSGSPAKTSSPSAHGPHLAGEAERRASQSRKSSSNRPSVAR